MNLSRNAAVVTVLAPALAGAMALSPAPTRAEEPMNDHPPTALYLERSVTVQPPPALFKDSEGLWVTPEELTQVNDFVLKPEGACLADLCIPVERAASPDDQNAVVVEHDGAEYFDLVRFANKIGQPVVTDRETAVSSFGAIPATRSLLFEEALAPDFELPDAQGNLHRLADHRGKKVLIITWASW
jgi:hypothetical protein